MQFSYYTKALLKNMTDLKKKLIQADSTTSCRLSTRYRIIRRHSSNGLGRSNAFLSIALVCNFAALLPGPAQRSRRYLANARGGGGGDTQHGEKGEQEGRGGRGSDEGEVAGGDAYGEHAAAMYYGERVRHSKRASSNSLTSRSRWPSAFVVPFSLKINKPDTRYPMLRHGTE